MYNPSFDTMTPREVMEKHGIHELPESEIRSIENAIVDYHAYKQKEELSIDTTRILRMLSVELSFSRKTIELLKTDLKTSNDLYNSIFKKSIWGFIKFKLGL